MKTKTHLLIATLLVASTLVSFSYASTWMDYLIPIEQMYQVPTCSSVSKIYLNEDNDADGLSDYYLYLNSNFIYNNNTVYDYSAIQIRRDYNGTPYTKVKYYRPLANMLSKVNKDTLATGNFDNATFWRPSRVFPYNTPVRGIASTPNRIVFERPSDNNSGKNTIGFVYDYRYVRATDYYNNSTSSYRYNQVPNLGYMLNTGLIDIYTLPGTLGNKTRKWGTEQQYTSCKNYKINRCGDGKIDTYDSSWNNQFSGEICDDGDLNGTQGHCPVGCGVGGGTYSCGDEIINDGSVTATTVVGIYTYGPTYMSGGIEQMEECDFGALNGSDLCTMYCTIPPYDAPVDEAVNE